MGNNETETAEDRFGRNVRRAREGAGLKQSDLAEQVTGLGLKIHPSTVAKIELRDVESPRSVRVNEAEAIARALNVPLDELLGGDPETRQVRATQAAVQRLLDARDAIPASIEQWAAARAALEDLLRTADERGSEGLAARFPEYADARRAAGQLLAEPLEELAGLGGVGEELEEWEVLPPDMTWVDAPTDVIDKPKEKRRGVHQEAT